MGPDQKEADVALKALMQARTLPEGAERSALTAIWEQWRDKERIRIQELADSYPTSEEDTEDEIWAHMHT